MSNPAKSAPVERHRWDQSQGPVTETLTWMAVDAELLHSFVSAATADGDAVLLGGTSDGGALLVSILSGGEKHASYFNTLESLENRLRAFLELA